MRTTSEILQKLTDHDNDAYTRIVSRVDDDLIFDIRYNFDTLDGGGSGNLLARIDAMVSMVRGQIEDRLIWQEVNNGQE